jgi:branched-subunit amino acid transport protein
MDEFLLIAGMAIVTFLIRYPILAIVGRVQLPGRVFRALRFVPPAVLTAIIIPEMFVRDGNLAVSLNNPYLIGGLISAGVAWRSKNLLLTIILGMAAFLLWKALVGGWL